VTEVKLSEDYDHILVKASIDKDAERMLREDTLFWVVKPRIGKEGISGLDTILSGSYIEMQPGNAQVEKLEFTVLDVPPVAPAGAEGLRIVLTHPKAGLLTVGDPVIYHGVTAGRVEKISFDVKQEKALYQLFIFQPYDELIRSATRFWINSGVDLQLNAEGVKVRFDSLESLLGGGVSFGIPEGESSGELVSKQLTQFRLFNDQQEVKEGLYDQHIEYVMIFEESLRGLNPGAPVEFRGLRIGSVEKIPLFRLDLNDGFKSTALPVLIRIEPKRIFEEGESISNDELREELISEFKLGLR
jgi:paraquat-inducible protein B